MTEEKGFFKWDETAQREWFEIELKPGTPICRAWIQDYASWAHQTPREWLQDGIVAWMHECDRQGAHGVYVKEKQPQERKKIPMWRTKLADRFYGWADVLAGVDTK